MTIRAGHELLCAALATDCCYVLGAGASSPHVPTMAQLPHRIGRYAPLLGSFAASTPRSLLHLLIEPLIDRAQITSSLDEWKVGAMTTATIAVILENLIAVAHFSSLPQYALFSFLPRLSRVISFNWDGLAQARCRHYQTLIRHPHGILRPRLLSLPHFEDLLDDTQLYDLPDAREIFVPGLVLPGEEEKVEIAPMREEIFQVWLASPQVVVVGYSFGLSSDLRYDRVWLDTFVEAMRVNNATIHIIDPNADWIRGELTERIKRQVNIHSWPLSWYALAVTLLSALDRHGLRTIPELRLSSRDFEKMYVAVSEHPFAAA